MKYLKSSFASFSALFLLVALSSQLNAQDASAKMNMSTVSSSFVMTNAAANYTTATTSVMLMNPKKEYTAPSGTVVFTSTESASKLKPVTVSLNKSKRVSLKLHNTEGCKTSPISTNKPFRFSAVVMTVKF